MSAPAMLAEMIAPPTWTGPIGPVRLEAIEVPLAACAAEIAAVGPGRHWRSLTMYQPGGDVWAAPWSAIALRGYSENPRNVHSPTTWKFAYAQMGAQVEMPRQSPRDLCLTTVAPAFPACLAVADAIPGESERIRINRLGPGGILPKHRDPLHEPRWEDRTLVRFHVPIVVPAGCVFFAWDRHGQSHQVCDPSGSVWFIDTDAPHMAVNASTESRYHLVVDKFLDDELRRCLEARPGEEAY